MRRIYPSPTRSFNGTDWFAYDYFADEVSAWDVPVRRVRRQDLALRPVLLPYAEWDYKPVTVKP